ncbi:MAG: hypothetical protein FWK01_20815 [Pantanalinema sp. GBBB05]|nr:hypothetical protein [Pantanalinema sp. GBBB05]
MGDLLGWLVNHGFLVRTIAPPITTHPDLSSTVCGYEHCNEEESRDRGEHWGKRGKISSI